MSFLTPGVYGRYYGAPMVWRPPPAKKALPPILDKLDEPDDGPPPYSSRKASQPPPDPDPSDDPSLEDEHPPPRRRRRSRRTSDASASPTESIRERPGPGWFNRPVNVRIPHVVRSFIHWVAERLFLPTAVVDFGFYVIENSLTQITRRRAKFIREHPEIAFAPPWKQERWLRGEVREDEREEYRWARYPWWEREAAKKAMERGEVYVWPRPSEGDEPRFISDE